MSEQLPVLEIIPEVKNILSKHHTLILQAPPGAGKSTLLPLEIFRETWLKGQKIIMLEPRRLAARSVANRMASLLDEPVGKTVGYRVRFENKTGKDTLIEVVTEGILTRMLQQDNALEGVGLVIFDEFHERSLHADLALALCRESQQVLREDLKLLIMSATLDGDTLSALLNNAPILTSKGRQHPIETIYLGNDDAPIALRMVGAIKKAFAEQTGDILAFLPGAGEIQRVQEQLEGSLRGAVIHPLYGDLPQQKQQEAILPNTDGYRKIVLATSIAETSLTIEGIRVVIDSGLARVPRFEPRSGLTRLETIKVTRDAADQRAGRAGRLGPGVCYRLWSEGTQHQLTAHRTAEILEADLAPTMLELAQWGIHDIRSLTWLTQPPAGSVSQAKELLEQLDATNEGKITGRGKEMLRLPTHPRIAHLLLEGEADNLLALATDIAALLEERDPLSKGSGANLGERVEILRKWRSKEYVSADRGTLERIERLAIAWRKSFNVNADNAFPDYGDVGLLIAAAYPERIAKQRDPSGSRYRLANNRVVRIEDHDPLINEDWLAVAQLDAGTNNEGRIYLAAPVDPKKLKHLIREQEEVSWDQQKGVLVARNERRLGGILVDSVPLTTIPEEQRVSVLCKAVAGDGQKLLNWTGEVTEWQSRVQSLAIWNPETAWPDVSTGNLLATADTWLAPYLTSVRKKEDFQRLDLSTILSGLLSWDQSQELEKLAPAKLSVPSGSLIKLEYFSDGRDPVLAVRLQELFGLSDTPTVNAGKVKVLIHLLSPGYKPVQVTQDLKSFWQNTYPIVKKELKSRYPKHHWPDDPWTAEAVRGVKRRV